GAAPQLQGGQVGGGVVHRPGETSGPAAVGLLLRDEALENGVAVRAPGEAVLRRHVGQQFRVQVSADGVARLRLVVMAVGGPLPRLPDLDGVPQQLAELGGVLRAGPKFDGDAGEPNTVVFPGRRSRDRPAAGYGSSEVAKAGF